MGQPFVNIKAFQVLTKKKIQNEHFCFVIGKIILDYFLFNWLQSTSHSKQKYYN